jgi:integrase/recombinase XerD
MPKLLKGLYQRGNIYWFRYRVLGKQQSVSLKTSALDDAVVKVKQLRTNPHNGTGETVSALIPSFIDTKLKQNRYTEATRRASISALKEFGTYTQGMAVRDITTNTIQRWFDGLCKRASESTAQTYLFRCRSFFKWAYKTQLLIENPTSRVQIGRLPPPRRRPFATDEQRKFLITNAPQDRQDIKFMLYAGFYAGLRKNEISSARTTWFNLEQGSITVPDRDGEFQSKDRQERTIPLAPSFLAFLRTYEVDPGDFMVGQGKAKRGASIYRYNIRKPFEKYVTSQDMAWVTPHIMRHTFASLLASKGESIYKIAKWLGDDVRTTQKHYAKLLPITDVSLFE